MARRWSYLGLNECYHSLCDWDYDDHQLHQRQISSNLEMIYNLIMSRVANTLFHSVYCCLSLAWLSLLTLIVVCTCMTWNISHTFCLYECRTFYDRRLLFFSIFVYMSSHISRHNFANTKRHCIWSSFSLSLSLSLFFGYNFDCIKSMLIIFWNRGGMCTSLRSQMRAVE